MKLTNRCWLAWLAIFECCHLAIGGASYPPEVIQQVESTLLSLFGHKKRPPRVDRSKLKIPEDMIKLYEMQTGLTFATSNIPKRGTAYLTSANTVRSFVHVESPIDRRFQTPHKIRLKFVPSIPDEESFQHAELALKRDESAHQPTKVRVLVEDILKPGRKGKHGLIKRVIDSRTVPAGKNATLKLDLTDAVKRWLKDPDSNHGVLVTVLEHSGTKSSDLRHNVRMKRGLDEDEATWTNHQPVLYTFTDDKTNAQTDIREVAKRIQRSTRAARRGRRKESNQLCMRHRMHVSFDDVGWSDWIVAPPGYDAFYCHGNCPFPLSDHLNTTNHAIVQTIMNSVTPSVPKVCCVPTQLNPISMLYLDVDKRVVLKNYKEMVVVGCGCR